MAQKQAETMSKSRIDPKTSSKCALCGSQKLPDGFSGLEGAWACDDCVKAVRARTARSDIWAIPERYVDAKMDDFLDNEISNTRTQIEESLDELARKVNYRNIIISGPIGVGKTHLAAAIANLARDKFGLTTAFSEATQYLSQVKWTFGNDGPGDLRESDLFDRFATTKILVLDDYGMHHETDWAGQTFWQIFNARYVKKLPIILTCNGKQDEIFRSEQSSGELDRLRERCLVIAMSGKSRRAG